MALWCFFKIGSVNLFPVWHEATIILKSQNLTWNASQRTVRQMDHHEIWISSSHIMLFVNYHCPSCPLYDRRPQSSWSPQIWHEMHRGGQCAGRSTVKFESVLPRDTTDNPAIFFAKCLIRVSITIQTHFLKVVKYLWLVISLSWM